MKNESIITIKNNKNDLVEKFDFPNVYVCQKMF